jgi:aldose 1-epimerase
MGYGATSSKPTPVGFSNHTYWNLAGHNMGSILEHKLTINSNEYSETDDKLCATGRLLGLKNTDFDFNNARTIGDRREGDYDLAYILNSGRGNEPDCTLADPISGRRIRLYTDAPSVVLYTGGFLSDERGKGGAIYSRYGGICLETGPVPGAVNHRNLAPEIVRPGVEYRSKTVINFS